MKYAIFAATLLMTGCSWWCPEYVMNPPEPVTLDTTIVTSPTTLEELFFLPEDGVAATSGPISIVVRDTVRLDSDRKVRIVRVTAECPPETIAIYKTVEATPRVIEKEVKYIPLWGWIAIAGCVIVALAAMVAVIFRRLL